MEENKEELIKTTPPKIPIKPLHVSSVPNIRGTKSEYFSSNIPYNDDESVLSPPVVLNKKRKWTSQENDEDIMVFCIIKDFR